MNELLKILTSDAIRCPHCGEAWLNISRRPFSFAYRCGGEYEYLGEKQWRALAGCPKGPQEVFTHEG